MNEPTRRLFLLLLAALACGPKTSNPNDDGPNPCQRYLDCLAATDQETFESELEVYGSNGSCFENSSAQTCYEVCDDKRQDLGEDDEACADAPAEDTEGESDTEVPDTPPGPDGKIDCADVPSGGPTVGGSEPGALGFPTVACSPRESGAGEYTCCSDDPSAVGGALPSYEGKMIDGDTPIFADANNSLSTWGLCLRTDDIPPGSGLLAAPAVNCPIPCDPTWAADDVAAVCGASRVCCQTIELQPEDCVMDPETMEWRPVRGSDIGTLTNWANAEHATHQDPSGISCMTFAGGAMGDAFTDCVTQLRVASQRGYCLALGPGLGCPEDDPSYIDACESINMGLTPPP